MDDRMKWIKKIGNTYAPASSYAIKSPMNERLCACKMDGEWFVFYSERGQMTSPVKCKDEAHAYETLYYQLKNRYGEKIE